MSLQLWFPLNGTLENHGLVDYPITSTGVTWSNSGKTGGKSYIRATSSASSTNGIRIASNMTEELGSEFSISVWIKPYGTHTHYNGTVFSSGNWNTTNGRYAFGVSQDNAKVDVFGEGHNKYINCPVPVNEWTHLVSTAKNKIATLYKNGEYVGQYTLGLETLSSDTNSVCIGRETYANGYFGFNGEITDLRVYNHCLSSKEAHELSKGLLLHYRFGDLNEGTGNLVKEGWGGTTNWTNVSAISTEVPSGLGITHSYVNNQTIEFIPINPDHSYTISFYIKKYKGNGTSGYVYFSIIPYDIDKLQIQNYHSAGLYAASRTILTQNLVSGDTVIHAQDTSGWKTTGSNYEYCAFFNYSDSTGYLYPPMTYTRNVRTITKANIDKTNNTIPLSAAYTGPTITCGVTICQSTAGSGYYYPYSSSSGAVADWVLKSVTFTPKNTAYIRAAKYVKVLSMSNYQYLAGITMVDNNADNTIYDESGFLNNGVFSGKVETLLDSPKASKSLRVINPHTSGFVRTYIIMPYDKITMSCWVKGTETGLSSYHIPFATDGSYEFSIDASGKFRNGFIINGTRSVVTTASKNVLDGQWHLLTATYDGTTIRRYVDGEEVAGSSTSVTGKISGGGKYLFIGKYGNGDTTYGSKNLLTADHRIYATALSPEDIMELYNVGGSVDNKGNMYCYEMKEV